LSYTWYNLLASNSDTFKQWLTSSKIALRTYSNSAISWTLLALAIRISNALRLGQEDEQRFHPFELQIRRRLWYSIALLDTFASLDRGTTAMLRWDDLGPAPLVLNDSEMSPNFVPKSSSPKFCDMSCFALMFRTMMCNKKILSMPHNTKDEWTAKLQLVSTFERVIERDYLKVSKDAQLLEKFTAQAATTLIVALHLVLRRPPYKQSSTFIPPSDDFDVLKHSTKVLQHELDIKSSEFAPYAWKSWVQWHALAIVLAELCSQPPGETYDESYEIAVRSFNHYSSLIADNDTGMLWKPIAKLMRRVERQRNGLSKLTSSKTDPLGLQDSSYVSDQPAGLNNMFNANEWTDTSALDFLGDMDLSATNESLSRGNRTMATNSDSQLNWYLFMEDVNLGYSLNLKEDPFYIMSTSQEHDDGKDI
jgi:Fungal specific transcription factor domain